MQTSMVQAETTSANINTSFEMVSKFEFDSLQEQLRETTAKLDQSYATAKYFEAELERQKSAIDKDKSLTTDNHLVAEYEQKLADEKSKTAELTSLVHSLQARCDEMNQQYNGEIISKKLIQEEHNTLQSKLYWINRYLYVS